MMTKCKFVLLAIMEFFLASTSYLFASSQRNIVKFGYDDQFEIFFDGRKLGCFSGYEDLQAFLGKCKKTKDGDFKKKNNLFILSKKTGYVEMVELTTPEFSVSNDCLSVGTLTLKTLYESYGHASKHITVFNDVGRDKISISYMPKLIQNPLATKKKLPVERWITFTFDYETQLCEKISIKYLYSEQ